jgi:hypothetical protein
MTERETLLAEIAEKQARLAELDALDPLLIEAREICAKWCDDKSCPEAARSYRSGEYDSHHPIEAALTALRRGMELAERPTLTREMVREAVKYVFARHSAATWDADALHAALVERLK